MLLSPTGVAQSVVLPGLIREPSDVVILLHDLVIYPANDVILVLHLAMHCLHHH